MDKVVLKNLLINLVGLILPTFVSLVTVPAYIKLLGVERYGVISLVWALIGYFSVLDLGMSLATENQISKAHAAHDDSVGSIFWSAFWLNLGTGVIGGIIIYFGAYFYTTAVLHLQPEFEREVLASLPWLALAIPVANVSWVFAGAITGVERFRIFNINQTLGTFLFQLLPLAGAYFLHPTLAIVLPAAVCARLLATLTLGGATLYVLKIRRVLWPDRTVVKGLFRYGRWVVLLSGVNMVIDTLDRVSIGSMLGARFVTFYTVPQNLVTRMNLLPDAMMRTLFPRMSASASHDADSIARQALAFLNGVFTPCVIIALLILGPFLKWWIGPELAVESVPIGRILIVGVWIAGQSSLLKILMLSQTNQSRVARLGLFQLPVFAAGLWFGIHTFGIMGAAVVVALRALLEYGLLLSYSEIRVRLVLADMASQFSLVIVGFVLADTARQPAINILAGFALVTASLGWSLWTSPRLRELLRQVADMLSHPGAKPEKEPAE